MKKIDVRFMESPEIEGKKVTIKRGAFCELYPLNPGAEFINRLLFLPFAPSKLRIFERFIPADIYTIKIPLKVHYLLNENEENGEIQRTMFLCRKEMTQIFVKSFGAGEYFGSKCGLCEQAEIIRSNYDDRRKQLGLYKAKLERDEYIKRIRADATLNSLYQRQAKFRPITRYLYLVFDLDKYEGIKPMAEDEVCQVQFLIAGKQIKDGIAAQIDAGHVFWDIDAGLHIVRIYKDTREGYAPDGILRSKYSVAVEPNVYKPDPNLLEYLKSEPFIDFSEFIELWDDGTEIVETDMGIGFKEEKIKQEGVSAEKTVQDSDSVEKKPILGKPLPKLPETPKDRSEILTPKENESLHKPAGTVTSSERKLERRIKF